ncbi:MAG: PAS domain S-box protein [Desulfobacterales bacterium]
MIKVINKQINFVKSGCILILLCLFPLFNAQALDRQEKIVRVGIIDFDPLCSIEKPGRSEGLFVSILKNIAAKEHWNLRFIPCELHNQFDYLDSNRADLVLAATYSKENAIKYEFTRETIISTWGQIYMGTGKNIKSILELEGYSVGMLANDPYGRELRKMIKGLNINCEFIEFKHYDEIFQALENGWIDTGMVDRIYAFLHQGEYKVKSTTIILSPVELRFAAPQQGGRNIITAIDYNLNLMKKNPGSIYYKLLDQILASSKDYAIPSWLLSLLGMGSILLVISAILTFLLRKQVLKKTKLLYEKNDELSREIEERMAAQKKLQESEQRYRSVFENTGTAIIIIEEDTTISIVNSEFEKLSGYKKGDIERKMSWMQFAAADDLDRAKRHRQMRIEGSADVPSEDEFRLTGAAGTEKVVLIKVGTIPGTGLTIASLLDISSRKMAEEALRESEKRLKMILDSVYAGIMIVNAGNFRIIEANSTAADMIGIQKHQLVGKICSDYLSSGNDDNCPIINQNIKTYHMEGLLKTANGQTIPILKTVTPVYLGGVKCFLETFINIRELKTAQEEKIILESRLSQAQKLEAIGTLAGGIAHDFNNTLCMIMGYADLAILDAPKCNSSMKDYLEGILVGCNRSKEVVKQILTFSRKGNQELKNVLIYPVIKEALKFLRSTLPSTIEIKQSVSTENNMVLADATQIHQVLMNLCTNALHAMDPGGGTLEVKLNTVVISEENHSSYQDVATGRYLMLSVSDTGCGMSREVMNRIFDPYFTTKDKTKGSGLGLSVAHGIINSHGGKILVRSRQGHGSTFHVLLPLVETGERLEDDNPVDIPGGSENILLVDDEKELASVEKKMLEVLGYHVTKTTNAMDALEIFKENADIFDLVITDMTMPFMTGIQLSKEIFRIRPEIPVVLCTGFNEHISSEKSFEIGISDFIMKPYDMRKLGSSIRRVLDEQSGVVDKIKKVPIYKSCPENTMGHDYKSLQNAMFGT